MSQKIILAWWWNVKVHSTSDFAVASGFPHDMCESSDLAAGGVGVEGEIVSPRYPQPMVQSRSCRLHIAACDECRVTLNFTELRLPNCSVEHWTSGDCVKGYVELPACYQR